MLRKVLRWAGATLGVLLMAVVLAGAGGYAVSDRILDRAYDLPPEALDVPTDSAGIERGRHLATAIAKCVECHGADLSGKVFIEAPGLGRLVAKNLTRGRGGVGDSLTDAQIEHVIRHGVRHDGKSLLFMPSEDWQSLGDADVAALIAYLRAVPPVDKVLPPSTIGPIGRALLVAGEITLPAEVIASRTPPGAAHAPAPPRAPTAEYGRYMANVGGCTGCHGPGLSGGKIPGAPPELRPAANLTPEGIGHWSEDDFRRALRTGVRPDGSPIDTLMPWRLTRDMDDDEIRALYAFLRTVPRRPYGQR
jgi:mono/diheme cytochrome c family protein